MHLVEEFARHTGHADIIREQIDGVKVPTLVLTLAGVSRVPWADWYGSEKSLAFT